MTMGLPLTIFSSPAAIKGRSQKRKERVGSRGEEGAERGEGITEGGREGGGNSNRKH